MAKGSVSKSVSGTKETKSKAVGTKSKSPKRNNESLEVGLILWEEAKYAFLRAIGSVK